MTGLFSNRTRSHRGPGRAYVEARRRQGRATLDRFAEALSEHGSIPRAAAEANIHPSRGYQLFARIRAELGEQAR